MKFVTVTGFALCALTLIWLLRVSGKFDDISQHLEVENRQPDGKREERRFLTSHDPQERPKERFRH